MNREIIVGKNMLELNTHGSYSFPFHLQYITLSDYPMGSFQCHWHPEIEIIVITEGRMLFQINQTQHELKQHDCIFVNTATLHAATMIANEECRYICLDFDPILVYGYENSTIQAELVAPVLESKSFPCCVMTGSHKQHPYLMQIMTRLERICREKQDGYHLLVKSCLCELWFLLLQDYQQHTGNDENKLEVRQIERLKQALTYIYANYSGTITLDSMAASCHISKSEFSRLFKKAFRQTPFEFLLHYRIKKSLSLLCGEEYTVTEISSMVGFSGSSYFTEVFRKYMLCTPTEYRRRHRSDASQTASA